QEYREVDAAQKCRKRGLETVEQYQKWQQQDAEAKQQKRSNENKEQCLY
ncbi:12241_t:CDS:1, partial [Racocetra fulgida]